MTYVGLALMIVGTLFSLLKKDFLLKVHFLGISDTVGAVLMVLGLRGDAPRTILMVVVLLVWGPFISHVLARMYSEGSSRWNT